MHYMLKDLVFLTIFFFTVKIIIFYGKKDRLVPINVCGLIAVFSVLWLVS